MHFCFLKPFMSNMVNCTAWIESKIVYILEHLNLPSSSALGEGGLKSDWLHTLSDLQVVLQPSGYSHCETCFSVFYLHLESSTENLLCKFAFCQKEQFYELPPILRKLWDPIYASHPSKVYKFMVSAHSLWQSPITIHSPISTSSCFRQSTSSNDHFHFNISSTRNSFPWLK